LREALFLVTDDTVLDIIEAVLAGNYYTGDYIDHVEYSVDFSRDKPCPTCGGSGKKRFDPDGCGTWTIPCPTCDGEGILVNVSGDRFKSPAIPCPDCGSARFVPGKGRGM